MLSFLKIAFNHNNLKFQLKYSVYKLDLNLFGWCNTFIQKHIIVSVDVFFFCHSIFIEI